jgi:hypothetical protein
VAVGDVVVIHPRDGGIFRGSVIQLDDRSAVVELHDRSFSPLPGMRGEVLIPTDRIDGVGRGEEKQESVGEHPPWPNRDESFSPDMPLLSQVKPLRPEERRMQLRGRFYTIGNLIQTNEDDFANSFIRAGTDLQYLNPFGKGGELRFDGEFNYKTEQDDEAGLDLLIQRLSYFQGGTRFSETRWEAGRFLQHGMPEFGVLDGFEWTHRSEGGDQFGASAGFMPQPDDDYESFADFQLAAYYLWVADLREELTIGAGYQKTVHRGEFDRDLLVAKLRYLPSDNWYLNGTVWVDFYSSSDNVKGPGAEVTQAVGSVGRRWDDGGGLDLSYRRQLFPELERNEFNPILAEDLADNRYDRLTLSGWGPVADGQRLHGQVGGWDDEEGSGGFAEIGIDLQNHFLDRDRLDITLFGSRGQFTDGGGARFSYGRYTENGRWDIFYEITEYHQLDFPNDRDDILQHRFRASRSFYTDTGSSLSFDVGATLWDSEWSWSIGFYVQKSF